jgi:ribosomal protein S18 acetylase RimI-like enzyme
MIDARNYNSQETLKNGMQVTFRAIMPDDKHALLAAFKELEARSIYLRFFGVKKELSQQELKKATEIDFDRTVALVTSLQDEAGEKIIGGGRYIAFGDADPPDRAEVAFAVEEDYQGLGIASIMLRHLAGIAKQKGIEQFYAEVLPENKGMLAVFSRSGFPHKREYVDGLAHVVLSLADDKS